MLTQAYFENIQQVIIGQIQRAKQSIFVAVAWLTDTAIFSELCIKAQNGLQVELILVSDHINHEFDPFNHKQLESCGGNVYFIPAQFDGSIMHHKFCVIDDTTVITGSYNWSKKAQFNDENIVLTQDAWELATQFRKEFTTIKNRVQVNEDTFIDYAKIMKRLEVIKSFAALEEVEEIAVQVKKLKEQNLPQDVYTIVRKLEGKHFSEALKLVAEFIKDNSRIAIYEDGEIFGLQLEIRSLEVQLNALENEVVEAEKLVHEFLVRHTKELGLLIIELLKLKQQTAATDEEREDADRGEQTYREGYDANKDVVIAELTPEEKQDLTKMYREASMLCHPDKFANEPPEKQKQAEELFKELAEAYSANDISQVNSILQNLKNAVLTVDAKNAPNKKELLKAIRERLTNKANVLTRKIKEIKLSESYRTAAENIDWDEYFETTKTTLGQQIDALNMSVHE